MSLLGAEAFFWPREPASVTYIITNYSQTTAIVLTYFIVWHVTINNPNLENASSFPEKIDRYLTVFKGVQRWRKKRNEGHILTKACDFCA